MLSKAVFKEPGMNQEFQAAGLPPLSAGGKVLSMDASKPGRTASNTNPQSTRSAPLLGLRFLCLRSSVCMH